MAGSRYHKFLRTSALVVVLVLFFDSGFIFPVTEELSDNTVNYLANSIGIYASVEPNNINTLNAELNAREKALNEREIAAHSFGSGSSNYSTYILSTILFILTVLIVLNYVMDWMRVRKLRHEAEAA